MNQSADCELMQAPSPPWAQPISENDWVYTADQDSNTVSVINPKRPIGRPADGLKNAFHIRFPLIHICIFPA